MGSHKESYFDIFVGIFLYFPHISVLLCVNPIWTRGGGGGQNGPLRVFPKYLKEALADLY